MSYVKDINDEANDIGRWRREKQFFTPDARKFQEVAPIPLTNGDAMLGKLMLCVCELAEAAEEIRAGNSEKFGVEVADAIIRTLDIMEAGGFNTKEIIASKMGVNWERPIKHGKKTNL